MDYRIYHAFNEFSRDHRWLAHAVQGLETVGVVLYGVAVLLLWLATEPGEERRWKIAALAGTASAGLSLLINQVIGNEIWHRPRPYESHPGVYHLSHSHDPSFPSDHVSAAFGIAFGIYFIDRRVGRVFVFVAALIGIGRVVIGAHYLTDVLASLVISAVVAAIVVRFGQPLLERATRVRTNKRSGCRAVAPASSQTQRGVGLESGRVRGSALTTRSGPLRPRRMSRASLAGVDREPSCALPLASLDVRLTGATRLALIEFCAPSASFVA